MSRRPNETWIQALRGDLGHAQQRRAHEDLANYLYVVAYNYLRLRQSDVDALAAFADAEMATLAQDFVQETLEKLARDDFALLKKYSGKGKFTSWAAQIVRRQAGQELRKSYWVRRKTVELEPGGEQDPPILQIPDRSRSADPEFSAAQQHIADLLQACLQVLPERYRLAFWRCTAENETAAAVAQTLDTSANAVYLLIHRAKQQMKRCLQQAGVERDILQLFGRP